MCDEQFLKEHSASTSGFYNYSQFDSKAVLKEIQETKKLKQ